MKTLLTDDIDQIHDEFDRLIQAKTRLFCVRRIKDNLALGELYVQATTKVGGDDLLVLYHPHTPSCTSPTCLFYYHTKGQPLRFFESPRVKKADKYLGLKLPREIYDIQRRRFPRVLAMPNSMAIFSFQHKQRVHHCTVADVSLGGARIVGTIPSVVAKGDVITPLTISLYRRSASREETRVHVPEAEVKWAVVEGSQTQAMGIRFSLPDKARQVLADYIDLRMIEG